PLRTIAREAEEIRRGVAQRGVLRRRSAVDKGHVGLSLCIVLDGDTFVSRKRADQDRDVVLFDELARRLYRAVGGGVRRPFDDLDLLAAGLVARFSQGKFGAADAVLAQHRERALQCREQADFDGIFGERDMWREYDRTQKSEREGRIVVQFHSFLR